MKQLALSIALLLLSGLAVGTFELKDPAAPFEEAANSPAVVEIIDITEYAVEGAGVKSCEAYMADRQQNDSMQFVDLNWVKGFITGVNYLHAETKGNPQLGAGLDMDALTLWIDNYCSDNPLATLSDASAALVDQLIQ